MEAVGFVPFWGFTPAINFFKGTPYSLDQDKEINVLLADCTDLRHILRTLTESLPLSKIRAAPLNIYVHETYKENLCRDLLLLTLMCETHLSQRERQEMFLDLYGNTMIRDKTA